MLSASGPYTLFAPNGRAFAKLPKGTVEGWGEYRSGGTVFSYLPIRKVRVNSEVK